MNLKRTSSDSSESSFSSKKFKPVNPSNHNERVRPSAHSRPENHNISQETTIGRESKLAFINHVIGTNAHALSKYYGGQKKGMDIWTLEVIQDICLSRLDVFRKQQTPLQESNDSEVALQSSDAIRNIDAISDDAVFIYPHVDHKTFNDTPSASGIRALLQEILGTTSLQDTYLRALCSFLEGQDVFVRTPCTGAKDLCFQVAFMSNRVGNGKDTTLIISPYPLLTAPQVLALENHKVNHLSWSAATGELIRTLRSSNGVHVVWVTPEKLNIQEDSILKKILREMSCAGQLARIIINDIHRIRSRDATYRSLTSLKDLFPYVPIMALTSQDIGDEIERRLKLRHCAHFSQSFNRKNLCFTVSLKQATVISDIIQFLSSFAKDSAGIIYTLTDRDCRNLTEHLVAKFDVKEILEEMPIDQQMSATKDWKDGRCHILVITSNASLNIALDRKDVRFVVHHHIPQSAQRYLEDTFPAGQDGLSSQCRLYYNVVDYKNLSSSFELELQNQVYEMAKYCENDGVCRSALLLQSLGETSDERCGKCDICRSIGQLVEQDFTSEARDIGRLVQSLSGNNITLSYCRQLFKNRQIGSTRSQYSKFFGTGSHLHMELIERLFDKLCFLGIINQVPSKRNEVAILVRPGSKIDTAFKTSFCLKLKVPKNGFDQGTSAVKEGSLANSPTNSTSPFENEIKHNDSLVLREMKSVRLKIMRDLGCDSVDSVLSDQILEQLSISCPSGYQGKLRV
ncbi:hypothetical protein K435DRAFT_178593 [Dendrothele bispora CBS 962.96]|uniref:DNA 3'-5' helicase n=1 Tax=Dendrothele bispora (strain CBS 962.96) TaxID=1314807 RepID=A0A4S8MZ93_DENBC|nr:hypothetical protein K435DRAFT_178593 [Dendrothele bispora CBS 962.96]